MIRKMISLTLAVALLASFTFAQTTTTKTVKTTTTIISEDTSSIFFSARLNPNLSEFNSRAERVNLHVMLEDGGTYTIFAPTNLAYISLSQAERDAWKDDYHAEVSMRYLVFPGSYTITELRGMDGKTIRTLDGDEVTVHVTGNAVKIGDATISGYETTTTTTLYEVDRVIVPAKKRR